LAEATSLARQMASSISEGRVVTLASVDERNLPPMFNSYCWAAELWDANAHSKSVLPLPSKSGREMRLTFPHAGIWIDAGLNHYTIVNTHKGGVVSHFHGGQAVLRDAGVVVRDPKGQLGSTQTFSVENSVQLDGNTLTIKAAINLMPKLLPTPIQFMALRLLCVTLFRLRPLREWAKQSLVRLLITRRNPWPVHNVRRIQFGAELTVQDELKARKGYASVETAGDFVAIHMASQGYWQLQDEQT